MQRVATSHRFWRTFVAVWVLACVPSLSTAEEEPPPPSVRSIAFEGQTTISVEKLRQVAGIALGSSWTPEAEKSAQERLTTWPYLASAAINVSTRDDQLVDLVVSVVERPVVGKVEFTGNDALSTESLQNERPLNTGDPYSLVALHRAENRLMDFYHRDGFLLARIRGIVTPVGQNRLNVVFEITEGVRIYIRRVELLGAKQVSSGEPLSELKNQPRRFFGIVSKGYYVPSLLNADLYRLQQYYVQNGYLEAKVAFEELRFNRKRTVVDLVLRVKEGRQWKFDGVRLEGNELFPKLVLQEILDLPPKGFYEKRKLQEGIDRLARWYQREWGLLPQLKLVEPDMNFEHARVRPVIQMVERPHLIVNKVTVTGNQKTKDHVVRSQITLKPDQPYTIDAQTKSLENIAKRGLFTEAHVEVTDAGPNRKDVNFVVKEREEFGEFEAGGGAASGSGEVAFLRLAHSNFDLFRFPRSLTDWNGAFTGGGQTLELLAIPGNVLSQYGIRFVEPHFARSDQRLTVRSGAGLFSRKTYDENHIDGEVTFRKFLDDLRRLSYSIGYVADLIDIDDLGPNAPSVAFRDEGETFFAHPRFGLRWDDTVPNFYSGSTGLIVRWRIDFGDDFTGSQQDFWRSEFGMNYAWGLFDRRPDFQHKLRVGVRFGFIEGRNGDSTHVAQRFYLGGPRSFPGFRFRELGPHDGREPIGGDASIHGNVQYSLPIVWREFRVFGLFQWGDLERNFSDLSTDRLRTAAGGGIQTRFKVLQQVVPANFYWMQTLSSESEDREQFFSLTIGVNF